MSTQRHMQSHSFSFYFNARKNPVGATTGFNSFFPYAGLWRTRKDYITNRLKVQQELQK